ncbi:hypothetical protein [Noviherbaspirillum sp. UKPF54]|uniref:hypothetical protein n=1 Tax=Noviherbaspirillum sp. UKPF54 TaxID=2601898 RepID=UPI0011B17B2C|nr:hypothetical protein [Noviherbaspirillum sp. UKPF54]QDZ30107.1 hypothetical protein FAY22_20370 [Noviherbaspirillum sp. UKPF54]
MNNSPPVPDHSVVPTNFPRPRPVVAAVNGKLTESLEEYDGKLYALGSSPLSLWRSWEICEELAQHLAAECCELQTGAWVHLSKAEILANQFIRMEKCGWGTAPEMHWIIRRVAKLLDWTPLLDDTP